MKLFTLLLAFILFSFNVAIAGVIKPDTLPPCEDTACNVVAKKITLETRTETKNLKIRIRSFTIGIPLNVTRIDIGNSLTVFRYETSPQISISTETDETLQFLKLGPRPISLSEVFNIIFNKTLKDPDITSTYDKETVNKLMWIKKGFLKKSAEAYVYEKGRVKIYYIPDGVAASRNLAWAIDSEHPNVAIRLESDLSVTDFAQILYSITAI